jgi:hypothetical protein
VDEFLNGENCYTSLVAKDKIEFNRDKREKRAKRREEKLEQKQRRLEMLDNEKDDDK